MAAGGPFGGYAAAEVNTALREFFRDKDAQ